MYFRDTGNFKVMGTLRSQVTQIREVLLHIAYWYLYQSMVKLMLSSYSSHSSTSSLITFPVFIVMLQVVSTAS